jgi:hypothetical protein
MSHFSPWRSDESLIILSSFVFFCLYLFDLSGRDKDEFFFFLHFIGWYMVLIHVFIETMYSWRLESPSSYFLCFFFFGDGSIHQGTIWPLMGMSDMCLYFYVHGYWSNTEFSMHVLLWILAWCPVIFPSAMWMSLVLKVTSHDLGIFMSRAQTCSTRVYTRYSTCSSWSLAFGLASISNFFDCSSSRWACC